VYVSVVEYIKCLEEEIDSRQDWMDKGDNDV